MSEEILELTTELDAVNTILASVGEAPVADLDNSFTDAGVARQFLARHSRRTQARGWTCNTDLDVVLTPQVSGEIAVPATTLRFTYTDTNITKRGTRLYDRSTQSFIFTDAITADALVTLLNFEDLPEEMREYITICAARNFSQKTLGDPDQGRFDADDQLRSWAQLLNHEAEEADWNVLSSDPLIARIKGKR